MTQLKNCKKASTGCQDEQTIQCRSSEKKDKGAPCFDRDDVMVINGQICFLNSFLPVENLGTLFDISTSADCVTMRHVCVLALEANGKSQERGLDWKKIKLNEYCTVVAKRPLKERPVSKNMF